MRVSAGACVTVLLCLASEVRGGEAGVGYRSVQAAFDALRARPGNVVEQRAGWTVIEEAGGPHEIVWSFAPPAHPAAPAAIRRDFVMKNGLPTMVTRFLCEGRSAACERLYAHIERGDSEYRAAPPLR